MSMAKDPGGSSMSDKQAEGRQRGECRELQQREPFERWCDILLAHFLEEIALRYPS